MSKKTPSQLLLRWCIQRGVLVIPESSDKDRITENMNVLAFKLSDGEMAKLDALNDGWRCTWDPTNIPDRADDSFGPVTDRNEFNVVSADL